MQTIGGREPMHGELGRFYDAIENPRKTRGELPILRDAELRAYMADVRERTLEVLDDGRRSRADAEDPLLRDGFVYEMLLAHELQHNETMLQLLQMVDGYEPALVDAALAGRAGRRRARRRSRRRPASYEIGAPADGFAYDNERGRHTVELAAFEIDRTPVGNGAYAEFMEETGAEPPLYWERDGEGLGRAPRWAAARRSTRPSRRPRLLGGGRRLRPLGRQAAADRAGVGGGPRRAWTASGTPGSGPPRTSSPTPASRPSPTREYSEVFFGDELQGAARRLLGDPPDVDPAQLPQLGPAPAPPDLLRHALREGRMIAIDVHLDADAAATMARDVRAGLSAYPEGAGAEVLLRRARLAALRADHRAARVLPDPGRARDPQRALGRDRRRRRRAAGRWSSSAPARRRRPATC